MLLTMLSYLSFYQIAFEYLTAIFASLFWDIINLHFRSVLPELKKHFSVPKPRDGGRYFIEFSGLDDWVV
jgi:hypothetical protein